MRLSILLVIAYYCCASAPSVWSAPLWDMAVRHLSDKTIVPSEVRSEERFISTEGKGEHVSILESTLFRMPDNRFLLLPHTGYANGEAIPKDTLRQLTEVYTEQDLKPSLFALENQGRIQLTQGEETRTIANHPCRRFSFTAKIDGHRAEGSAWLAMDSGLPLEVEWLFIDVPYHKQDGTTVISFQQKDFYKIGNSGQCTLNASEVAVSLKYHLFFVPYEGRLQRKKAFAQYRQRQDLPLYTVAGN